MKSRFRNSAVLVLLSLAALAVAAMDGTYSLARIAKVGDEAKYEFEAELDFNGEKISISGKNTDKVTKVDEDGSISYESSQKDVVVKAGDQIIPMDDEATVKIVTGPNRAVKSYDDMGDEDASSLRLAMLGTVLKPPMDVKVGDKWNGAMKSSLADTYPIESNFEAVAVETIGKWETVKVKVTSKETAGETPATCEGFVWVITADGTSAKEELHIKNAPLALSPVPIDMKIKIKRTE